MKKYLFLILPLFALACAPINEKQCRAGNWFELGIRDGEQGRLLSHADKYVEECAKFSVAVDRKAWAKGREEGLKSYCTISNAERLGRAGSGLRPVCQNQAQLQKANDHGYKYYKLTQELEELKAEREELLDILDKNFSGELTDEQQRLKRRYERRLDRVDDDIRALRRLIRNYPPFQS